MRPLGMFAAGVCAAAALSNALSGAYLVAALFATLSLSDVLLAARAS